MLAQVRLEPDPSVNGPTEVGPHIYPTTPS
jgi:hypothetical protein